MRVKSGVILVLVFAMGFLVSRAASGQGDENTWKYFGSADEACAAYHEVAKAMTAFHIYNTPADVDVALEVPT
jgi:hypothetical protein